MDRGTPSHGPRDSGLRTQEPSRGLRDSQLQTLGLWARTPGIWAADPGNPQQRTPGLPAADPWDSGPWTPGTPSGGPRDSWPRTHRTLGRGPLGLLGCRPRSSGCRPWDSRPWTLPAADPHELLAAGRPWTHLWEAADDLDQKHRQDTWLQQQAGDGLQIKHAGFGFPCGTRSGCQPTGTAAECPGPAGPLLRAQPCRLAVTALWSWQCP